MSATHDTAASRPGFPTGKNIYCILPDDGTDKRVEAELREQHGIIRTSSVTCRGIGALAEVKTKRGKLPEPTQVKQLCVTCSDDEADRIFDFIFRAAQLDKPGRGIMWQQAVAGCTPYELPADIPDEKSGA